MKPPYALSEFLHLNEVKITLGIKKKKDTQAKNHYFIHF